ncbi:hypothetical protein BLNAU_12054 [Blattamonas nauphoetae]|uniref:DNA mismatch repair protein HSM3 N-terminal domain-containing protein n=1 Tax=Blattamonas nauphoetae TaxID=2049346 RepID=A0ABQ9XRW5_9EUKA|nr:hypothetical protein BLNAU_12054 [Blattamonas nauphoetae]
MTEIEKKTDSSSNTTRSDLSSSQLPFSMDCSPFLNWSEEEPESVVQKADIFRSLVATVKLQPALDDSLERKAINFLESVDPDDEETSDAFLRSLARNPDESLTHFVQSLMILLSTPSQVVTAAAMKRLDSLILRISAKVHLDLVNAGLIPQVINSLTPQSLSLTEAVNIHTDLVSSTLSSLWLATPNGLTELGIKDGDEQRTVHETVLQQVVAPLEKYIWHLCVNRYSIVDGDQSYEFMLIHSTLLEISPYYQPTMDFVLNMPVVLTIPSFLTFLENDPSIFRFLSDMIDIQQEWNKQGGKERQMWKTVHRMLRMEGFEDVIEQKLRNVQNGNYGRRNVIRSIAWNNLLGMNLLKQE